MSAIRKPSRDAVEQVSCRAMLEARTLLRCLGRQQTLKLYWKQLSKISIGSSTAGKVPWSRAGADFGCSTILGSFVDLLTGENSQVDVGFEFPGGNVMAIRRRENGIRGNEETYGE